MHVKSKKHIDTLKAQAERLNLSGAPSSVTVDPASKVPIASMTLAQKFQVIESNLEDNILDVPGVNPFDNVFVESDVSFNPAGQPIMFTAGETTGRPHTKLWNDMDALDLHNHSILGKMSHSVEDMFGDSQEDSTISACNPVPRRRERREYALGAI
ncbi:hypothetical protein B0H34DRAFT_802563 [Crassisporium funariophilum]|nr:hypothetical protein B0H34DRAFT_802563 [Crassisporium funariophilum]